MDDPTRRTKKVAYRPPTIPKKANRPAKQSRAERKDFSQIALGVVEKATGEKLKGTLD